MVGVHVWARRPTCEDFPLLGFLFRTLSVCDTKFRVRLLQFTIDDLFDHFTFVTFVTFHVFFELPTEQRKSRLENSPVPSSDSPLGALEAKMETEES